MVKGYVVNNTEKARHIFKRRVSPGQRVPLEDVYETLKHKVSGSDNFVKWLKENTLPRGWDVYVERSSSERVEQLTAKPIVSDAPMDLGNLRAKENAAEPTVVLVETEKEAGPEKEDDTPGAGLQYAPDKRLDKLTAQEIADLKIKDNPRRVLERVYSIHKLRRALTLCNKSSGRKQVLSRHIRRRIKKLEGM